MRLPVDGRKARPIRISVALTLALALGACGVFAGDGSAGGLPLAAAPQLGPGGDYPLVVGNPYMVGGTAYTPEDVLNYDQVGYLAADAAGGNAITGSHHTLPLPSYAEVTSLATGRTILVRLERRGPMNGNELVALSPGALAQLEASAGTPVRMRRVNPPEEQRMLLRAGGPAEPRMDTPMSLVEILKRRLPGQGAQPVVAQAQAQPARAGAPPALPPLPSRGGTTVAAAPQNFAQAFPARTAAPAPAPARQVARGSFMVQAASFSTADRARSAARVLEGEVSPAGQYFRVHTGPFASRAEAEASLAKVRAAGYRDARIQTSG